MAPGIEGINELTISNAAYLSQWLGNSKVELPLNFKKFDSMLTKKTKKSKLKNRIIYSSLMSIMNVGKCDGDYNNFCKYLFIILFELSAE